MCSHGRAVTKATAIGKSYYWRQLINYWQPQRLNGLCYCECTARPAAHRGGSRGEDSQVHGNRRENLCQFPCIVYRRNYLVHSHPLTEEVELPPQPRFIKAVSYCGDKKMDAWGIKEEPGIERNHSNQKERVFDLTVGNSRDDLFIK